MKTTINPYLNFDGKAEEAFNFYKSVFGGEFSAIMKMSDAPNSADISEIERNRVMHIALPINKHTVLMASDIIPSFGHTLTEGNNAHLSVQPCSREETERIYDSLSSGGTIEMPLADMFWGSYYGSFRDKFGIQWMVSYDKCPEDQ